MSQCDLIFLYDCDGETRPTKISQPYAVAPPILGFLKRVCRCRFRCCPISAGAVLLFRVDQRWPPPNAERQARWSVLKRGMLEDTSRESAHFEALRLAEGKNCVRTSAINAGAYRSHSAPPD